MNESRRRPRIQVHRRDREPSDEVDRLWRPWRQHDRACRSACWRRQLASRGRCAIVSGYSSTRQDRVDAPQLSQQVVDALFRALSFPLRPLFGRLDALLELLQSRQPARFRLGNLGASIFEGRFGLAELTLRRCQSAFGSRSARVAGSDLCC